MFLYDVLLLAVKSVHEPFEPKADTQAIPDFHWFHCLAFPAILRAASPNQRLNLAVIGCGGEVRGIWGGGSENIVALCDVNENNLKAAAKKFPGPGSTLIFGSYTTMPRTSMPWWSVALNIRTAFATLPALQSCGSMSIARSR